MRGAITRVVTSPVTPATDPVSVAEVKDWCRIETEDSDDILAAMIAAATQHLGDVDGYSGLAFITQTYDWTLDGFPYDTDLCFPRWPVQSVTLITYTDANGAPQTWSSLLYQVDTKSKPARLRPAYGETWPVVRTETFNSVTIRFVAGYGNDPSDVPEPLRTAIKALVAHWHEYREPVIESQSYEIPNHVRALVYSHRLHMGIG